jgi:hypothetical protein
MNSELTSILSAIYYLIDKQDLSVVEVKSLITKAINENQYVN